MQESSTNLALGLEFTEGFSVSPLVCSSPFPTRPFMQKTEGFRRFPLAEATRRYARKRVLPLNKGNKESNKEGEE